MINGFGWENYKWSGLSLKMGSVQFCARSGKFQRADCMFTGSLWIPNTPPPLTLTNYPFEFLNDFIIIPIFRYIRMFRYDDALPFASLYVP